MYSLLFTHGVEIHLKIKSATDKNEYLRRNDMFVNVCKNTVQPIFSMFGKKKNFHIFVLSPGKSQIEFSSLAHLMDHHKKLGLHLNETYYNFGIPKGKHTPKYTVHT